MVQKSKIWGCTRLLNSISAEILLWQRGQGFYGIGLGGPGGLDHQMIPEHSSAVAHRSFRGWVKCGEQWDFNV